jgi:hypothetical protein
MKPFHFVGTGVVVTTGEAPFPECQKHSGKTPKHSGKASPSATLGEGQPGKRLRGRGLPRVPNLVHSGKPSPSVMLPLGENLTPSPGFFYSSPSATPGEEIPFF